MGIYETIKEGLKLVQATDNMPLIKNYMDIQNSYQELQEELRKANDKINQLEERLQNKAKVEYNELGYYEEENSSKKYCSRCFEVDNQLISLHEDTLRTNGVFYVCPQCKTEILKEKKESSMPIVQVSNVKKSDNFRRRW